MLATGLMISFLILFFRMLLIWDLHPHSFVFTTKICQFPLKRFFNFLFSYLSIFLFQGAKRPSGLHVQHDHILSNQKQVAYNQGNVHERYQCITIRYLNDKTILRMWMKDRWMDGWIGSLLGIWINKLIRRVIRQRKFSAKAGIYGENGNMT